MQHTGAGPAPGSKGLRLTAGRRQINGRKEAVGSRSCVMFVVVIAVVVVVVVGTNKDWGPENKLSEPILEFAWCSLGASMEFSTVLKDNFG